MGKKSSDPPPPDYRAAAQETATGNLEMARQATAANRPTQVTPFGTSSWYNTPGTDEWVQDVQLAPDTQAALESQQNVQKYMSDLAQQYEGKVATQMDQPYKDFGDLPKYDPGNMGAMPTLDYSSLGDMPDTGYGEVESIRQAMLSRMQPDFDKQSAARRQQLAAQGITQGSEISRGAEDQIGRNYNDLQNQALLGAMSSYRDITGQELQARAQRAGELHGMFGAGIQGRQQQMSEADVAFQRAMAGRQQGIQEEAFQRQLPLNELNALLRGNQVQSPNFPSFSGQGPVAGPNMLGAADQQYMASLGQSNANKAAGSGMLGGVLGAAGGIVGGIYGGPAGATLGYGAGNAIGGYIGSS